MGSDSVRIGFLSNHEKKNSTNELEIIAIVWSCEHFQNFLLGNHFEVLIDHRAIILALKTNRGTKTHQYRSTRWADCLLPFDFDDFFRNSRSKLGIVGYLSRFPFFEAAPPISFDKQYVVKRLSRFFNACSFLDRWAHNFYLQSNLPLRHRKTLTNLRHLY